MRFLLGVSLLVLAAVIAGCFKKPALVLVSPAREPQSVDTAATILQRSGLAVTPQRNYIIPLLNGAAEDEMGAFCACRSSSFRKRAYSSSNPHKGQDFNADGTEKSVALANVVVRGTDQLSSTCGYYVDVEDGLGFQWRYLHLNKPDLQVGDVLKQGQLIGIHQSYPTPACGTGPHLHFQRLNQGPLSDSQMLSANPCGGQPRSSCGFDPNVLFGKGTPAVSAPTPAPTPKPSPIKTTSAPAPRPVANSLPSCNPRQPLSVPAEEPVPGGRIPARVTSYITEIKARPTLTPSADGRSVLRIPQMTITTVGGRDESANFCSMDPATKESCVAYWQLQIHDGTQWRRVFSDGSARNHSLVFRGEYCLPGPATKKWRFRIVAVTELERTLVQEGEIGDN